MTKTVSEYTMQNAECIMNCLPSCPAAVLQVHPDNGCGRVSRQFVHAPYIYALDFLKYFTGVWGKCHGL